MNKTSIYYFSLAAIAIGSLASCQEADFGFDSEAIRLSKYNQKFKEEFGEASPNHDWGFGLAEYFMGMSRGNLNTPQTRADEDPFYNGGRNWKMDDSRYINGFNYYPQDLFSPVEDIKTNEYREVYAWFSTHRVDWGESTPDAYTDPDRNITAHITKPATVTATSVFTGEEVINELDNIYLRNSEVAYSAGTANPRSLLGSLLDDGRNNPIDGQISSQNPEYINGWIQIVAGRNLTMPLMNHLVFRSLNDVNPDNAVNPDQNNTNWIHIYDFNEREGYGYYRTTEKGNAELVMGSDFSIVTYMNSFSNSYHDKYFIVYLEGDGYSGYYLGLDFESKCENEFAGYKDGQPNGPFPADGFCNDLIIKIGDAGSTPYNPCRIMCEDLGTDDFDFNDLVYDVNLNNNKVTITVQAVGGTIPIKLTYGETILWEELHTTFGEATSTPINVLSVRKEPISRTIAFKDSQFATGDIDKTSEVFEINKINIYVQRNDKAEWLKVADFDQMGGAPQKICLPNNSVRWTVENGRFKLAYPGFYDWVKNPLLNKFWDSSQYSINQSLLWN